MQANCHGGLEIELNEGFWRASNTSSKIYQCISKGSCLGGFVANETIPVKCKEGHTGPLCSVCTFYHDAKYMRQGIDGCNKCPNKV